MDVNTIKGTALQYIHIYIQNQALNIYIAYFNKYSHFLPVINGHTDAKNTDQSECSM